MINAHIPPRILAALLHVRDHIPTVDRVVFWEETQWTYLTDNLQVPSFDLAEIDVSILEDAVYDLTDLPAAYQLEDYECRLVAGTYKGEFYPEYRYTWGDAKCVFTMLCEVAQDLIPEFEWILKNEGWKIDGKVEFSAPPWLADRLVKIEPQEK